MAVWGFSSQQNNDKWLQNYFFFFKLLEVSGNCPKERENHEMFLQENILNLFKKSQSLAVEPQSTSPCPLRSALWKLVSSVKNIELPFYLALNLCSWYWYLPRRSSCQQYWFSSVRIETLFQKRAVEESEVPFLHPAPICSVETLCLPWQVKNSAPQSFATACS